VEAENLSVAWPEPVEAPNPSSARLDSVDVLRGLTIAGMIVVNDPGTWSAVYPPLLHAEWNGCTYTDTIFPFFLFLAGVSLALSFAPRRAQGQIFGSLFRPVAVRSALLIALGLVLNFTSMIAFQKEHLRFSGVLQRIGICVLVAGAIFLAGGGRAAAWSAAVILLLYWALMGTGPLDPERNLASRIDRAVLAGHRWTPDREPEGILSTFPAIATALLGTIAGERLRSKASLRRKVGEFLIAGSAAFGAGLLWSRWFPLNKNLWTSSYVLLTAGLAAIALALCMAVVDIGQWRRWAAPLRWLGRNAIGVFTFSSLGGIALRWLKFETGDGRLTLGQILFRTYFDRFADPRLGSLAFALAYLGFWILVVGLLYRRRIFLRI
jgi:predicted acyltransferase